MSKKTKSVAYRIAKITGKIERYIAQREQATGKKRHSLFLKITGKKRTLNRLNKLLSWGIQ